jgi:hypothetical protein
VRNVDGAVGVESAIRQAGFVSGFDVWQLLLGELAKAALNGREH